MNKTSDLGNPISGYRSLSIQLPEKVVSPEDAMCLTSREEVQNHNKQINIQEYFKNKQRFKDSPELQFSKDYVEINKCVSLQNLKQKWIK